MGDQPQYRLIFHHRFPQDLEEIPKNMVRRILRAIEDRLTQAPEKYGERLRQSLRGFWKLRVGDYRVVYEIVGDEVRIYGVRNRREVYGEITKRTEKGWPRE